MYQAAAVFSFARCYRGRCVRNIPGINLALTLEFCNTEYSYFVDREGGHQISQISPKYVDVMYGISYDLEEGEEEEALFVPLNERGSCAQCNYVRIFAQTISSPSDFSIDHCKLVRH